MSEVSDHSPTNTGSTSRMPSWLFGTLIGVLVIALGFGVMAGLYWLTDRGSDPVCAGEIDFGYAPDLTKTAKIEPTFQVVDDRCRAWFDVNESGEIVAYKTSLSGHDCSVVWNLETKTWECGTETVAVGDLEQWPLRINQVGEGLPTVVVDFGAAQ